MADQARTLANFLVQVKQNQEFWALQDKTSTDWVVLDSINFKQSDVMPLWSSLECAQQHCCDEWQYYTPEKISVSEWFEFWFEDLNEDGVIVGIDWPITGDCVELEIGDFSQALAQVETL